MSRYTRAQWGARHRAGFGDRSRNYPLAEAWAHHSVTAHLSPSATFGQEAAQMRVLESIGQNRFKGGISYNFVIFPSGRAYHGLGASRIGAHTAGRNSISLSVVFAGNYETTQPTAAALGAAAQLLKDLRAQGILRQPRFSGGHGDAPGNSTACPGRHLRSRLGAINSQAAGSATPAAPAPSSGSSSSGSSSNTTGVTGRFLRVTANSQANLRSGPGERHGVIGTAQRGALLRRNPSRDTVNWYGVGDRWFIGKSVASPVRADPRSVLVIGDWPGRRMPINGTETFELNQAWRELLARIGVPKGNRGDMMRRWLSDRGHSPGNPSDLQRYLNANVTRPRGVSALVVDGNRGPLTRAMEKRFLNSQIQHLGSKYPQHYRHTP